MKRFIFAVIIFFFIAGIVLAYSSPGKPTGFVNDFARILTTEQKSALETKLSNYARGSGAQIAVVTIPSLGGDTIENYAVQLFKEWGIGNKSKDSGLLLLIAPNERQLRIEVGYGLEPSVTDAMSSTIIRTIITPAFKTGDYYGGINSGLNAITGLIDKDPAMVQEVSNLSVTSGVVNSLDNIHLIIVLMFLVTLLVRFLAQSKSWWQGGVIGLVLGAIFAGLIGAIICTVLGLLFDFLLSKYGSKWFPNDKGPRGPRGPLFWLFGGGGRGGSGGGFGGFGGGGSGGGGSSGSW